MINLNEYQLKIIISIELLNLCQTLIEADSHISNAKPIGQICWSSNECQVNSLCLKEGSVKYGTCQCLPGYIRVDTWLQCIKPKHYYQSCEFNLECKHYDPNTVCESEPLMFITRCFCADYHKYNNESDLCEWCDRPDCRRHYHHYKREVSLNRYNRWYHNVNGLFGIWASLLIMALPIGVYLFFLGIRISKKLFESHSSGGQQNRLIQSIDIDISQPVFVTLPSDNREPVLPQNPIRVLDESPPDYEDLAKSIRLPTYYEAIHMNS